MYYRPNPKFFGLYSLRSGGATSAANAGVPDRLFKLLGRWRSENVKDGYIKNDLKALLSVSIALGIQIPRFSTVSPFFMVALEFSVVT